MTAAWEVSLPHADKLLLIALADNANDEGHCCPSVATLGCKCGMDDPTVQRVVARLVGGGHVTVMPQAGRSNDYLVTSVNDLCDSQGYRPGPFRATRGPSWSFLRRAMYHQLNDFRKASYRRITD